MHLAMVCDSAVASRENLFTVNLHGCYRELPVGCSCKEGIFLPYSCTQPRQRIFLLREKGWIQVLALLVIYWHAWQNMPFLCCQLFKEASILQIPKGQRNLSQQSYISVSSCSFFSCSFQLRDCLNLASSTVARTQGGVALYLGDLIFKGNCKFFPNAALPLSPQTSSFLSAVLFQAKAQCRRGISSDDVGYVTEHAVVAVSSTGFRPDAWEDAFCYSAGVRVLRALVEARCTMAHNSKGTRQWLQTQGGSYNLQKA